MLAWRVCLSCATLADAEARASADLYMEAEDV